MLSPCGAHKNYVYSNNKDVNRRIIFGGQGRGAME